MLSIFVIFGQDSHFIVFLIVKHHSEELFFGDSILIHGFVIVEVLRSDVGQYTHIKLHTMKSMLSESM